MRNLKIKLLTVMLLIAGLATSFVSCDKSDFPTVPMTEEVSQSDLKSAATQVDFGEIHNSGLEHIMSAEFIGTYNEFLGFSIENAIERVSMEAGYNVPLNPKPYLLDLLSNTNPFAPGKNYAPYLHKVYKADAISKKARNLYIALYKAINSADHDKIYLILGKLGNLDGTEKQLELYNASIAVFNSSVEFWTKYQNASPGEITDEEVWQIAGADLFGLAHGSIFGPWFAAVESIVCSAIATTELN